MKLSWNNITDIEELKRQLDDDEVILASGDTVLGLYAPLTLIGYETLNTLKQRSGKPYLVLISSPHMLPYFVDQVIDDKLQRLMDTVWPGPVTLIFKAKADLPKFIKDASGTIALRVPNHQGLKQLLISYKGLFSTSANLHTEPIPTRIDDVNPKIKEHIRAICLDDATKQDQVPSTILDCSSDTIKVVREGVFNRAKLQEIGVL